MPMALSQPPYNYYYGTTFITIITIIIVQYYTTVRSTVTSTTTNRDNIIYRTAITACMTITTITATYLGAGTILALS